MHVYDAIKARRAVRKFSDQPVARADIEKIVNAGRLSGSAKNRQPWTFIVVEERDTLQQLVACGSWCTHVAGATFAVVLVVDDLHEPHTLTTPFDLGRTSQNMILTAWEMGIGSVMGTIYEQDIAHAALSIPKDKDVPWLISFGYPDAEHDPRNRPPRKEGREALDQVLRWGQWSE